MAMVSCILRDEFCASSFPDSSTNLANSYSESIDRNVKELRKEIAANNEKIEELDKLCTYFLRDGTMLVEDPDGNSLVVEKTSIDGKCYVTPQK